jgi:nucleotide-binding universal stress UspA family protein
MKCAIVPLVPAIELKRILYATDFSEASRAALPLVAAIARRYGSSLLLAHVWPPAVYPMVAPEAVAVLDRREEREARKSLERLLGEPVLHGIPAQIELRCGSPSHELERMVDQQRVDLVVASTHGKTGFKHRVLGSVTEELVRKLSCPVLTVGPQIARKPGVLKTIDNILFPTDFSPESLAVFPYLASLAHEYHSHLTVLHVLPLEAAGNPEAKQLAEPLRRRMEHTLSKQISPRSTAEFVIEAGNVVDEILACARRVHADLIGLGVRCATDIAMHFQETTAYRILAESECPVLTHHGER